MIYIFDVAHVLQKVRKSLLQRLQILIVEICLCHAAVVLQRTNRCNDDNRIRFQTGHTAFDVQEFLCAKVTAEACLCNGVITEL